MTLEEKALMCSGKNFWETQSIERLGIPSITLTDGPYGVVKRLSGFSDVIPATCFPTPSALASSWDVDLLYNVGKAIGIECQAEDVQILLAPGINIQRSPLGGRNFEYYSEDPVLSGEIGAAFINGVQSEGVGACVKHYIANNQEYHRQTVNNIIDEQALNEIYLYNFEIAVEKGNPFVAMAAYNKLNGIHCTENKYILNHILKSKWKFHGFIVSDWYAVNSIVNSLKAGLDLEMPSSNGFSSKKIVEAVLAGQLDEAIVDKALENILDIVFKVTKSKKENVYYDKNEHNKLAREVAKNCIVLLKNKHNILPLKKEKLRNKKIAVIGEYAKNPRFQGEGSAHVNPTMVENAYDEILKLGGNSIKIKYSKGYSTNEKNIYDNNVLIKEAQKTAMECELVILFIGTPDSYDREGFDRKNINLPDNQIKLLREIKKVQKNVIVVLSNGSPIVISPWYDYADAILETWLTGQASGGAVADVLFGIENPSGKLSATFPVQLSDNPTYLDFLDLEDNLQYKEGIFVGYRYYDKKNMEVAFPFGFGLSYTNFNYRELKLSKQIINENDTLEVRFKIKNTGKYFGKEIAQVYLKKYISNVQAPEKELKAFAKILLFPDEEKEVSFTLNTRDFSYYDVSSKAWIVDSGVVEILIGKSSRDICLIKKIYIKSSYIRKIKYTREILIREFLKNPKSKGFLEDIIKDFSQQASSDNKMQEIFISFLMDNPIEKLLSISNGKFTEKMLTELLEAVNKS
ncbi:glycoside hydrolase family 3 C-terminal domain-containing protein [Clostridium sp. C2-6-12]|uniref:glycoside hydrolase family 3 C-terminal domain-containing protein n=1 Tax=Clostridium sp. C2-6-12 TaxID=2698832 RepID=UPI001923B146